MESLEVNPEFWRGKRVFLTGHTGFKGGWLTLWLGKVGAKIYGYALAPPTEPNLFTVARVAESMSTSIIEDIRDPLHLTNSMQAIKPEIVIHMAAQPIVRESYTNPVDTYLVNVMGTINLLEAVRVTPSVRAVLVITTDKCYENREWFWSYRENEALGGRDPYSSSKACAEIATNAWRSSFFEQNQVAVATARAGNVIGGGDWAKDRLLPDFLRALDRSEILYIRSPNAIRPWQHVLESLSGYLGLAERLFVEGNKYAEAWNFGPSDEDAHTVGWIIERLAANYTDTKWECEQEPQPNEARCLKLDSSKARECLGWKPKWRLETALDKTLEWHSGWRQGRDMHAFSIVQIGEYTEWKKTQ